MYEPILSKLLQRADMLYSYSKISNRLLNPMQYPPTLHSPTQQDLCSSGGGFHMGHLLSVCRQRRQSNNGRAALRASCKGSRASIQGSDVASESSHSLIAVSYSLPQSHALHAGTGLAGAEQGCRQAVKA